MDLAKKLGYETNTGSYVRSMKTMIKETGLDISHFVHNGWNKNNYDYSLFSWNNHKKKASD